MDAELYQAYSIWRRAIRQCVGYAASGTITRNNKLVEASGVLGSFETENEADSLASDGAEGGWRTTASTSFASVRRMLFGRNYPGTNVENVPFGRAGRAHCAWSLARLMLA